MTPTPTAPEIGAEEQREWFPHLDYAGEPMQPGQFRDGPGIGAGLMDLEPAMVTQADRDAAAAWIKQARNDGLLMRRANPCDIPTVRAFARHRLAERERCAKMADLGYNIRMTQKNAAKMCGTRKDVRNFECMATEASMIAHAIRESAHDE